MNYKFLFLFIFLLIPIFFSTTAEAATTTIQIYASSGDGAITSGGTSNWTYLRSGNNLDVNKTATERNVYIDPEALRRLYFPFDTSSIPDTAQIVSATLHLTHPHNNYQDNNNFGIGLLLGNQDNLTDLSAAKWNPKTFVRISNDKDITTFSSANQSVSWVLNETGTGAIEKGAGGITSLVIATTPDINNTTTGLSSLNYVDFYMSEQSGTDKDPYLEITYVDTWSIAPADNLMVEGALSPQSVADATPEFSAEFSSFNGVGKGTHYQIQVSTSSSGWGSNQLLWDSTKLPFETPLEHTSTTPSISYNGIALVADTTYYWRMKIWDQYSNESPWSVSSYKMDDELTVKIYTSSGDGAITSGGTSNWSVLRDGNNLDVNQTALERNVYVDPGALRRLYLPFDTSVIPSDASITSAILKLVHPRNNYSDPDGFSIGLIEGRQASTTSLTTNEWGNINFTRLANDLDITSFNTTGQSISWTLNSSGINTINIGIATSTSLVIATSPDIDNSNSGLSGNNYVDFNMSESPNKPYLEITYSR